MSNLLDRARRPLAGAFVVASMLAVPVAHASAAPVVRPLQTGTGLPSGFMPRSGRAHASVSARAAHVGASSTDLQLQYFGGPLIQHVKVVQVLWGGENGGSGVTYTPQVKGTVTPNLQGFYSQVTNSSYMDWLKEYNAGGQTINRGTFVNKYQITPDPSRDGSQASEVLGDGQSYGIITDASIQDELKSQIAASHLPAPDADTLYMLHFPSSRAITADGFNSIDDFCAYHGSFVPTSGPNVRYAVIPDTAGRCAANTAWRNITAVASHEMVEAITDPDVTLATDFAPPLSWMEPFFGEIGDICNLFNDYADPTIESSRIIGGDSYVYTVEQMWSNRSQRCVTTRTVSVGDGSVVEGANGQRGLRIPVTLSVPSASADVSVNYTVTGASATPGAPAPGNDYGVPKGSSGTITFTRVNGQTPVRQTVLIMVYGDADVESNESFTVTLSSPSNGYTLGRSVATATIVDDDATPLPAGKLRALAVGDSSVSYGGHGVRQLAFPISLSKPSAYPTVLHWTLHDGTAKFGPEYLGGHVDNNADARSGVAVIPAGSTGVFLYVDVRSSHMATVTKQMTISIEQLSLYPLPGWMAITRGTGTGTIFVG